MSIYAPRQHVTDLDECMFYHSMDIPGYGFVEGSWDLRETADLYLGGIDFAAKRVLEIGKASGFLTFTMEGKGAEVIAHDLSPDDDWDVVPYACARDASTAASDDESRITNWREWLENRRLGIQVINNGFWLAHRAHESRAKVVTAPVYDLPTGIGPVDVAVFGSVLLHLRDPFLALQRALRLTRETLVVTDLLPSALETPAGSASPAEGAGPSMAFATFVPDPDRGEPFDTWWHLSPALVQRMAAVLGFAESTVHHHHHMHRGTPVPMYTVVARRSTEMEPLPG